MEASVSLENRRASVLFVTILVVGLLLIVGLTWMNFLYTSQDSGPNDFYPAWLATRALLLRGINPYDGQAVTAAALSLSGGVLSDQSDFYALRYPIHATLVFAPFALINDPYLARALWMTLLELALMGNLAVSVSLSRWKPDAGMLTGLLISLLVWYFTWRPLLDGDVVILTALLLSLALLAVRSEQDSVASFLLAFTLIKGEIFILPVIFIALWGLSHRRGGLLGGTLAFLAFFFILGLLFASDWPWNYARLIVRDYRDLPPLLPLRVLQAWLPGVGRQLGWGLTLAVSGICLWQWGSALRQDWRWFYWTHSLTITAAFLVGLPVSLDNTVVLLPSLVLILAIWDQRWGKLGKILIALLLLLLILGTWTLALRSVRSEVVLDMQPLFFFFTPLIMLIGLVWVRWWAIRPPRLYLQEIMEQLQ